MTRISWHFPYPENRLTADTDYYSACSADLQNAVENENYHQAAELRDEISKLEAKSLAASVKAQAYESAKYALRLGQKVKHKIFGNPWPHIALLYRPFKHK